MKPVPERVIKLVKSVFITLSCTRFIKPYILPQLVSDPIFPLSCMNVWLTMTSYPWFLFMDTGYTLNHHTMYNHPIPPPPSLSPRISNFQISIKINCTIKVFLDVRWSESVQVLVPVRSPRKLSANELCRNSTKAWNRNRETVTIVTANGISY